MVIVGVAMHDEQVKGGKMTKLTSFIARPCPMRRSSSVARRLLLYARRPCSTFPLAIVVVVVVAVVDERKEALRGRGGAEEARGRKTLEVDIDRRPQEPAHVIWARMGANVSPKASVSCRQL